MAAQKKKNQVPVEATLPALPSAADSFNQPIYALLIGLLFFCMLPTWLNPPDEWVYEDFSLTQNQFVADKAVGSIFTTRLWAGLKNGVYGEPLYRPFFLLSLMPFANNPFAKRAMVWLSYLALGLLLFFWIRRANPDGPPLWALAGMTLFLLHPLGVETKSQLGGLSETAPLLLAGLAFYVGARYSWWGLALMALAPGFKETGFFVLIGFCAYLFHQQKTRQALVGIILATFWAGLHFFAVGGWGAMEHASANFNPLVNMGPVDAVVSRLALVGKALWIVLLPTQLSSDYSAGTLALPAGILSHGTLFGLAAVACLIWRARTATQSSTGWFVLSTVAAALIWNLHLLGCLSGVFSERAWLGCLFALYLAVFSRLATHSWAKPAYRWLALSFIAVLLCFYSVVTFQRQPIWSNSIKLYKTDSTNFPENGRLLFNYGVAVGATSDWPAAKQPFLESLRVYPDFPDAHYRLYLVYNALGEKENAEKHHAMARRLGFPIPAQPPKFPVK